MNKLFVNNIGDLAEAQRASFYRFLSIGISEELKTIDRLALDYSPHLNVIRKVFGFLTFGYSRRKFIVKKVNQYYLREIHQRHLMVQMIQNHLAQE